MAGVALVLDLLKRKNTCFGSHCVRSYDLFSATAAASAAASSFAVTAPFATWAFFGYPMNLDRHPLRFNSIFSESRKSTFDLQKIKLPGVLRQIHRATSNNANYMPLVFKGALPVSYCDAGVALGEDDVYSIKELQESFFQQEPVTYHSLKAYNIELKPLLSAFQWKNLALTSLRSFLLFYLPLLEPHSNLDEDDDDFLQDTSEEQRPDLIVPLKKSLKQIVRDTIVVTTRRVLERLAVHYVSQRLAWKLLKDARTSATRKAVRSMPSLTYIYCVSKTTFRAQFLGILAAWLVQVSIDIYRLVSRMFKSDEEADEVDRILQIQQLGGKIYVTTLRCGASLVFASIGAGIGAVLFKPSAGQWIGSAIGDLTGPVIVSYCLRDILNVDL